MLCRHVLSRVVVDMLWMCILISDLLRILFVAESVLCWVSLPLFSAGVILGGSYTALLHFADVALSASGGGCQNKR